jgi:hypothetical protein
MKAMSCVILLETFAALILSGKASRSQTLVTFDNLVDNGGGTPITNAYQGLSWSNFDVLNSILLTQYTGDVVGYYYGMVSPSNIVYDPFGSPAYFDSPSNFNFLSAYLTGAWNSNLNIQVEGFNGTNLMYNQTVVASATNATLFTFNYTGVNRVYFDSFGGEPAFGGTPLEQFVMDNMTFEFIPEPSALLLVVLGAVPLCAFLRRRRRDNSAPFSSS